MNLRFCILIFVCFFVTPASLLYAETESLDKPQGHHFKVKDLLKSDIDKVLEVNVEVIDELLKELMHKLYARNPRELKKSPFLNAEESQHKLFSYSPGAVHAEFMKMSGIEALNLSFDKDYEGDRVFMLVAGLRTMIFESYQYKKEFFMLDSLDAQKLYNSARNIEIANWKLRKYKNEQGELFLLSNEVNGSETNLSYERLFGKLIATQDNIARVIAGKTGRTISKVIIRMATAVFIPL